MNDRGDPNDVRLGTNQRRLLAVLGLGLIMLLGVAATLEPDPRGYGTHQQLGWPPCGTQQLLGIRCPSCGMTTSWAHLARGHLRRGLAANVAGVLLWCGAAVAAPWLLISAVRGKWFWRRPSATVVTLAAAVVIGVAMVDWVIRLVID